jgi:hypothetical protein
VIICNKADFAREIQGIESLWLDSWLSVVVGPSRDGALGVIGVSGKVSLINKITVLSRHFTIGATTKEDEGCFIVI